VTIHPVCTCPEPCCQFFRSDKSVFHYLFLPSCALALTPCGLLRPLPRPTQNNSYLQHPAQFYGHSTQRLGHFFVRVQYVCRRG
jgi:hypothetical protein